MSDLTEEMKQEYEEKKDISNLISCWPTIFRLLIRLSEKLDRITEGHDPETTIGGLEPIPVDQDAGLGDAPIFGNETSGDHFSDEKLADQLEDMARVYDALNKYDRSLLLTVASRLREKEEEAPTKGGGFCEECERDLANAPHKPDCSWNGDNPNLLKDMIAVRDGLKFYGHLGEEVAPDCLHCKLHDCLEAAIGKEKSINGGER